MQSSLGQFNVKEFRMDSTVVVEILTKEVGGRGDDREGNSWGMIIYFSMVKTLDLESGHLGSAPTSANTQFLTLGNAVHLSRHSFLHL